MQVKSLETGQQNRISAVDARSKNQATCKKSLDNKCGLLMILLITQMEFAGHRHEAKKIY